MNTFEKVTITANIAYSERIELENYSFNNIGDKLFKSMKQNQIWVLNSAPVLKSCLGKVLDNHCAKYIWVPRPVSCPTSSSAIEHARFDVSIISRIAENFDDLKKEDHIVISLKPAVLVNDAKTLSPSIWLSTELDDMSVQVNSLATHLALVVQDLQTGGQKMMSSSFPIQVTPRQMSIRTLKTIVVGQIGSSVISKSFIQDSITALDAEFCLSTLKKAPQNHDEDKLNRIQKMSKLEDEE